MYHDSTVSRRRIAPFLTTLLVVLIACAPALAQRESEVVVGVTKTAHLKTDILVNLLDVLSGGTDAQHAAETVRRVLGRDLVYSGLFRVGASEAAATADSLRYQFAITGKVEGPLRDAETTGTELPTTISLNLVTYPEGQLLLNKRYRPLPTQLRPSAHHFANQVVELLTGEKGIALTRVVFSRGNADRRDLYVVDYDGENLLRMTANRTLNLCPAWKPDGSEIAFTSYTQGQQGIFSLDISTGKVRSVIATEGLNLGADWHPFDDELILSLSKSGNPEIYRITAQGEVKRRLTVSSAIEISPHWSPSGKDVVFTSDRTGTPQLYIMDGDGAGRHRLTFEGQYNCSAAWSPNGEQVVYACREDDYTQLVLIKTSGLERRILTNLTWRNAEDPSWAPDGRHVVFSSDRSGTSKLYILDVIEGTFRQLTFGDLPDITPAWSP